MGITGASCGAFIANSFDLPPIRVIRGMFLAV